MPVVPFLILYAIHSLLLMLPFYLPHMFSQLRSFNSSLVEVEQAYQQSLQNIEAQYQSRESYSNVLEKEMSAALK